MYIYAYIYGKSMLEFFLLFEKKTRTFFIFKIKFLLEDTDQSQCKEITCACAFAYQGIY